ncbi:MAG: veratrol--corrinoid protein metyltransferase, partial [Parasporobacterium sp.]|nr:veratrol--corrinoid protein metyltransferase [Parasporobacterium sp.]
MTEKENVLMMFKDEQPEWVPRSLYGPPTPGDPYKPAFAGVMPSVIGPKKHGEDSVDIFGVPYTATDSAGGGALPTPNAFILDDITKWHDVIKVPSLEGIDWEQVCKKDMAHVDRENQICTLTGQAGVFQLLMNFMGFTEGLCALYEEPEECKALFDYLLDFYVKVTKEYMYWVKPDILGMGDDNATARAPFISLEMYRELCKPSHMRMGQLAIDAGIPVNFHDCGKCEDQIEDWFDFGVKIWNPAQIMNDLVGIKKKYGNKLILCGCWDSQGPAGWTDAQEDFVREQVRECIDTFAPGGGFIFT